MTRYTSTDRDVRAGCFVCHGSDAHWWGGNAQGVAARHHDATGHATWCDVYLAVRYGQDAGDARQTDIEDAIAFASSGGKLPVAPLPASDAPTATTRRRERPTPHGRTVSRGAKTLAPETPLP